MAARKQPKGEPSAGRDKLHRLVDEIPPDETVVAELFLEYLKGGRTDAMLFALATAPWDDEPETEEERRAVEEAKQDLAQGRVRSWEEIKAELFGPS